MSLNADSFKMYRYLQFIEMYHSGHFFLYIKLHFTVVYIYTVLFSSIKPNFMYNKEFDAKQS